MRAVSADDLTRELGRAEAVLVVDPMRAGAYSRAASLRRSAAAAGLDPRRVRLATDAALAEMAPIFGGRA